MKKAFEVALVLSASDKASRVVAAATAKINQQMKSVSDTASKSFEVGRNAAAIGTGFTAVLAGPLAAAAKMESLNVSLRTSFQGNEAAAAAAFKKINDFAAKTPYELSEVTTGFIKLKNMGLDPSEEALTAYGNTASAMGKSLNDMVEAVADATTGEFERLKEFGIKSSSEGDRVTFTFQGVKTTVGKNSKEIEQYLKYIGNVKFAGGIEAQSKTVNGMLSTLKDGAVMTAAKIGTTILPRVKELMNAITPVIDRISKWVERNPKLTSTILAVVAGMAALSFTVSAFAFIFGGLMKIYQAALAIKRAYIFLTTSERVANIAKTVATSASTVATWAATAAQWALNAALLANPITWVILAMVALIAVVVLLVKNWDKVRQFFLGLWAKIKDLFAKAWEFVKKYGWLMVGPVGWIIKAFSMLPEWFSKLWPKVKQIFLNFWEWLKKLPAQFLQIGAAIITGIWDGIKAKATALFNYVKDVGKKIAGAFKSVLGIASPSKVFMDYGVNITEGAKKGIEKGSPALVGASGNMGKSIAPSSNRSGGGGSMGGVTININVGSSSGNAQDIAAEVSKIIPRIKRELEDAWKRQARLSY